MITAAKIVAEARSWLGSRYHHQGRLKKCSTHSGGVDCFGLIFGVARDLKIRSKTGGLLADFNETGYSVYPDGARLRCFLDTHLIQADRKEIRPGDVLLFKMFGHPRHVGIAADHHTGNSAVIHCHSRSGKVVEHLLSPAWQRMLTGVYRFRVR